MRVETSQLRETASRLLLLGARLESRSAAVGDRANRTVELLDRHCGEALVVAWRGVADGLRVLSQGYTTYARGFLELADRYDELDGNLLADPPLRRPHDLPVATPAGADPP